MQNRHQSVNRTTEKALSYIRQAILTGQFPAGSLLPTNNLADEIGVSRTPIRDALRQLETEGLVTIAPRQEARVKELTFEDYKEMCELRIALETHAAQLAALRRTESDLEQIRYHFDAMAAHVKAGAPETVEEDERRTQAIAEADVAFHLAIIEASGNRLIKREAIRFRVIQSLVRLPKSVKTLREGAVERPWVQYRNRPSDVLQSHQDIFEAIRDQSAERAYGAMRDHLESSLKVQLRILRALKDQEMQRAMGHSFIS